MTAQPPGAPPRRTRVKRAERIESFLEATGEIITSEGVAAVSMDRVAERVGVNKAMVYRYWANREELLVAVLEREMADLDERAFAAASAVEGFEQRVAASLAAMYDVVGGRGVALALLQAPSPLPEVEASRRRAFAAVEDGWARLVVGAFGIDPARARVASAIFIAGLDAMFRLSLSGEVTHDQLIAIYAEMATDAARGQHHRHQSSPL